MQSATLHNLVSDIQGHSPVVSSASSPPARFLVVHPGRQHSHQLAWALEEAGLLGMYVHGSPLPQAARQAISPSRRRFVPLAPVINRLAGKLLNSSMQAQARYRGEWAFASMLSATLRLDRYTHVVAYENAALPFFRRAIQRRLHTILDAASIHYVEQDRLRKYPESERFHSALTARKDEEIRLAGALLTCSDLARRTYVENGVPVERVHTVLLGAETASPVCDPEAPTGEPRLLFVGRLAEHKGVDLLAAALKTIRAAGRSFTATIVADIAGADEAFVREISSIATIKPTMPADKLNRLYAASDCLILPSRFDSFGLVVPEALAQGCPAIVSTGAGASALIRSGENGVIVPGGDEAALGAAILAFLDNLQYWRSRRSEIAEGARRFAWSNYRAEIIRLMQKTIIPALESRVDTLGWKP